MLFFFFFNDTATTEIYTLSLHDALPIYRVGRRVLPGTGRTHHPLSRPPDREGDRKSTRLNSSHMSISYAVFCLKKKKKKHTFIHDPPYWLTFCNLPYTPFISVCCTSSRD